jgi:colanic acid biosynthesis glycosyl transferase WcaI
MLARLYQKGVERDRAILFPNWVNLDNIYPDREAGRAFRNELAIPENVIIALYSGNMGEKQGLRTVIDAATLLNDRKDIFFLMCGDGSARESLVKQAEGLVNIKFIDLQPLERLNGLLNSADIHLLPQRADAADLVLPSKLTGMLASGSPVVAGAERNTSIGEIIQEAGGLCCKPENAEEMAHAIAELAECEALRQEYGRRAREYALKNFSQSAVLAELRRQLESLVLEQYA